MTLKNYTVERMAGFFEDPYFAWNRNTFVELRDLTVSRLTLFNAIRGGEPASLTLSEWQDAENGAWLDPTRKQKLEEVEAKLFKDFKITLQAGKGNKLVSILFPEDCCGPMRKLANPEIRAFAEIHKSNHFMFPCTQN